jgi:hypothetical protein
VPCNENPIYESPEKELRGLSPNFYIHVSVSDLYTIGPHILQQNRQTYPWNIYCKSLTDTCIYKIVEFMVLCLCSVGNVLCKMIFTFDDIC